MLFNRVTLIQCFQLVTPWIVFVSAQMKETITRKYSKTCVVPGYNRTRVSYYGPDPTLLQSSIDEVAFCDMYRRFNTRTGKILIWSPDSCSGSRCVGIVHMIVQYPRNMCKYVLVNCTNKLNKHTTHYIFVQLL